MVKFPVRQIAKVSLLLTLAASAALGRSPFQTDDWIGLAPAGEGFAIKLPVKPEVETQRVPVMGNTYLLRLYTTSDERTGLLYWW